MPELASPILEGLPRGFPIVTMTLLPAQLQILAKAKQNYDGVGSVKVSSRQEPIIVKHVGGIVFSLMSFCL